MIKRELAGIVLDSQAFLQHSMLEVRALPSASGGNRKIGSDILASYQMSAVETADAEFRWLMEQQKLASSKAYAEAHHMRDSRHAELLEKIRAASNDHKQSREIYDRTFVSEMDCL